MIVLEITHILVSKNEMHTLKITSTVSGAVSLCLIASTPTTSPTRYQVVTWIYSVYGSVKLKTDFLLFLRRRTYNEYSAASKQM